MLVTLRHYSVNDYEISPCLVFQAVSENVTWVIDDGVRFELANRWSVMVSIAGNFVSLFVDDYKISFCHCS